MDYTINETKEYFQPIEINIKITNHNELLELIGMLATAPNTINTVINNSKVSSIAFQNTRAFDNLYYNLMNIAEKRKLLDM